MRSFLSTPLRILALVLATTTLFACNTTSRSAYRQSMPVTFNGYCEQREVYGYSDTIRLTVDNNAIKTLDWTAKPDSRSCHFELKNFTQVPNRQVADLQSNSDKNCHIYVWRDNNHITVATNACENLCAANDKMLPVLLNPLTNTCVAKKD